MRTRLLARRAAAFDRRAGFTLIEILAVLVILAILVSILVTSLGGAEDATLEGLTEGYLMQLSTALDEYEHEFGDYPLSTLGDEAGLKVNGTNMGAEALVVAPWSDGWEGGGGLSEDDLGNTDGDQSVKQVTDFGNKQLFELLDHWGNPIAYFHNADYGSTQIYQTYDPISGEAVESTVKARKNAMTGRYQQPQRFQLISAGIDGEFGTADDIGNFKRE